MASSGIQDSNDHTHYVAVAAKIFEEYGDFIYAVIRYHVKNEAQADDLFQNFFLFLAGNLPPNVRNMKSYLYRAIINDVIDAGRKAEKYQNLMREYAGRLNYSINEPMPADALNRMEQMNEILRIARERLPASEAEAVILRYRDNFTVQEIARVMSVTKESASRYICVGLKKIRQFLTAKGGKK